MKRSTPNERRASGFVSMKIVTPIATAMLLAGLGCQSRSVATATSATPPVSTQTSNLEPVDSAPKAAIPQPLPSSSASSENPTKDLPVAPRNAATIPPTSPAKKKRYRVAAVGDSLTDERVRGGKYLEVLRTHCPSSQFDNYGIGGEMVNQMLRRFERDVIAKRFEPGNLPYTDVIIFGGVNDLYSNISAGRSNAKIERDLGAMYDKAHAAGIRVVAVTVAPWGGFTRYYNSERAENTRSLNAWIQAQLASGRVDRTIDTYGLLSCGDPEKLCADWTAPFNDGLHFGAPGHERLGLAVLETAFADCE
jgi:lysophospholipase L1-like esterase